MTSELERDEVILFVVRRVCVGVAVCGDLLLLQGIRVRDWRPDRLGVSADADGGLDVVLGDSLVSHAWGRDRVREPIEGVALTRYPDTDRVSGRWTRDMGFT